MLKLITEDCCRSLAKFEQKGKADGLREIIASGEANDKKNRAQMKLVEIQFSLIIRQNDLDKLTKKLD